MFKRHNFRILFGMTIFIIGGVLFFPDGSKAVLQTTPQPGQNEIIASMSYSVAPSAVTFGRLSANNNVVGFLYRPPRDNWACSISVDIAKQGSPTDSVVMGIYQTNDATTFPSGAATYISDNFISASDLTITRTKVNFSLSNCFGMASSGIYWVVLARTGAESNTNNYLFYTGTTGVGYPSSAIDFTSWGDRNGKYSPTTYFSGVVYGLDDSVVFNIPTASASCNGYSTTVQKEACIVFKTLFVPSNNALDGWLEVRNDIANHKPISYFYGVTGLFSSTVASDSDNFLRFGITATLSNSDTVSVSFFNISTLTSFVPLSTIHFFRSLLEYALWIMFAMWCFHEAKILFDK